MLKSGDADDYQFYNILVYQRQSVKYRFGYVAVQVEYIQLSWYLHQHSAWILESSYHAFTELRVLHAYHYVLCLCLDDPL